MTRSDDRRAVAVEQQADILLTINDAEVALLVEPMTSLLDALRDAGLTSVHAGCEHGVCGSCTILLDGQPTRSCLVLALQAEGHNIETVEGLGSIEAPHALQVAFSRHRGLQCGFCTPGFLMLAEAMRRNLPNASEEEIRDLLSSNICRCTGYQSIIESVKGVLERDSPPDLGLEESDART